LIRLDLCAVGRQRPHGEAHEARARPARPLRVDRLAHAPSRPGAAPGRGRAPAGSIALGPTPSRRAAPPRSSASCAHARQRQAHGPASGPRLDRQPHALMPASGKPTARRAASASIVSLMRSCPSAASPRPGEGPRLDRQPHALMPVSGKPTAGERPPPRSSASCAHARQRQAHGRRAPSASIVSLMRSCPSAASPRPVERPPPRSSASCAHARQRQAHGPASDLRLDRQPHALMPGERPPPRSSGSCAHARQRQAHGRRARSRSRRVDLPSRSQPCAGIR
jgi:hypothetical protein